VEWLRDAAMAAREYGIVNGKENSWSASRKEHGLTVAQRYSLADSRPVQSMIGSLQKGRDKHKAQTAAERQGAESPREAQRRAIKRKQRPGMGK
jgi:hypothetical protein